LGSLIPLGDLVVGWRLLSRLPGFLRHPIDPEQARSILRGRLERREADFLALIRRAVYANRSSPYRQLLQHTGCEYGDVERLVSQEGIEAALRALYRNGVYLTVDEFKGRRPAVRGSATIMVEPHQVRNPALTAHLLALTSGSRGGRTAVPIDLRAIRDRSVNICLSFEARGGRNWLYALWGVPGSNAVNLLELSGSGTPTGSLLFTGRSGRGRLESALPLERAGAALGKPSGEGPVAPARVRSPRRPTTNRPLDGLGAASRTPPSPSHVSSPAVRLCQAALEAGLDIRRARFNITGEPVTAARLAVIRRTGAEAAPSYGSIECTPIGRGCLRPEAPDDVHLFHDLYPLIQAGAGGRNDLPPRSLLVSSLRLTAPVIMLNVSLGDQAELVQRACGCPLEALGWVTHLHTIRSFEKLTAGG